MIFSIHIKSLSKVAILLLCVNLHIGSIEAQKSKKKASESAQESKQEVVIYPVCTNYTLGNNLSAVQLKYSFSHQVFDIHKNTLIAVNKEGTLGIFLSPELVLLLFLTPPISIVFMIYPSLRSATWIYELFVK